MYLDATLLYRSYVNECFPQTKTLAAFLKSKKLWMQNKLCCAMDANNKQHFIFHYRYPFSWSPVVVQ